MSGNRIELRLGVRPEEPIPSIAGGPEDYPDDVSVRLDADARAIIGKYPQARSALLPLLHLVQAEDGYLTSAGIRYCAGHLGLSAAEVAAVATFYSMYRRTPTGEYLVGVCTNTLCAVMGGDAILKRLENHLRIGAGQTTDDGTITLEHIECNAACDFAPVIMVNWEFFDNQNTTTAVELVDRLRSGMPPAPSRGGPLATFRETACTLAALRRAPEGEA
ncbi:NADH-quinone oxidoreductase subunit NuoE [soil metagenome]